MVKNINIYNLYYNFFECSYQQQVQLTNSNYRDTKNLEKQHKREMEVYKTQLDFKDREITELKSALSDLKWSEVESRTSSALHTPKRARLSVVGPSTAKRKSVSLPCRLLSLLVLILSSCITSSIKILIEEICTNHGFQLFYNRRSLL